MWQINYKLPLPDLKPPGINLSIKFLFGKLVLGCLEYCITILQFSKWPEDSIFLTHKSQFVKVLKTFEMSGNNELILWIVNRNRCYVQRHAKMTQFWRFHLHNIYSHSYSNVSCQPDYPHSHYIITKGYIRYAVV